MFRLHILLSMFSFCSSHLFGVPSLSLECYFHVDFVVLKCMLQCSFWSKEQILFAQSFLLLQPSRPRRKKGIFVEPPRTRVHCRPKLIGLLRLILLVRPRKEATRDTVLLATQAPPSYDHVLCAGNGLRHPSSPQLGLGLCVITISQQFLQFLKMF